MATIRKDGMVTVETELGDPPYLSHIRIDGKEIPVKWFSVRAEVNPPTVFVEFEAYGYAKVSGKVPESSVVETRPLDPSELDPDGPFGATQRWLAGLASGCCAHPEGHTKVTDPLDSPEMPGPGYDAQTRPKR